MESSFLDGYVHEPPMRHFEDDFFNPTNPMGLENQVDRHSDLNLFEESASPFETSLLKESASPFETSLLKESASPFETSLLKESASPFETSLLKESASPFETSPSKEGASPFGTSPSKKGASPFETRLLKESASPFGTSPLKEGASSSETSRKRTFEDDLKDFKDLADIVHQNLVKSYQEQKFQKFRDEIFEILKEIFSEESP